MYNDLLENFLVYREDRNKFTLAERKQIKKYFRNAIREIKEKGDVKYYSS